MDLSERLKMLPPDGTMEIVTEKKDYKSNIIVIRCPEELRSPSDPEYHMAILDRNVVGTNYSGNSILDKLCPELPKVKLPKVEKPKTNYFPPKKYTGGQEDFHSTRRGNRFASRRRPRSFRNNSRIERHDKPYVNRNDKSWTERNDKSWQERSWTERSDKSRIDRNDKSWMEWSTRSNAADISPWEEGKQPWNNVLTNIQVPIFNGNIPMNMDFHEVVSRPVPPPVPVVLRTSPSYPKKKGLLGDHPFDSNTFLSVPKDLEIGNGDRNQTRTGGGDNSNQTRTIDGDNRDHTRPGSSDNRNHSRTGSDDNRNQTWTGCSDNRNQTRTRGNGNRIQRRRFPQNNNFKRKPFSNKTSFQNDERNSEASLWNADEGARLNNRTRGQNHNRQRKSFERGRSTYRPRSKY